MARRTQAALSGTTSVGSAAQMATSASASAPAPESGAAQSQQQVSLVDREASLAQRESSLAQREAAVAQREASVAEREAAVSIEPQHPNSTETLFEYRRDLAVTPERAAEIRASINRSPRNYGRIG